MSTIAKLQAALTVEPQDTDELVAKSGLTQCDVVEALGALEITGAETVIVEVVSGRRDADGDSSSAPDCEARLNGTPRRWKWLVSRGLSRLPLRDRCLDVPLALVFGFFAYWIENIGYTVAFWLVMFVIALLVASTMEFDEDLMDP